LRCARKLAQLFETPLIAFPACRDPALEPARFGFEFLVEFLCGLEFGIGELLGPCIELRIAVAVVAQLAPVHPEGVGGDRLQKGPVMTDHHKRLAPLHQIALEPFDGRQIEMVGRLVEQQDVGVGEHRPRHRGAPCFATRQRICHAAASDLDPGQGGVDLMARGHHRHRQTRATVCPEMIGTSWGR